MEKQQNDLMNRYIYQVISQLPRDQRSEIKMELEELISDMYDARNSDTNMENILLELGDPLEFAKRYRDESKYLISPEYFDDYCWLVKIVLAAVALSAIVSFIVQLLFSENSLLTCFINLASTLFMGSICGFGIITVIFAFLQHQHIKVEFLRKWKLDQLMGTNGDFDALTWKPEYLPKVPNKKALINRGDSIAGIIFTIIFAIFIILLPSIERLGIMTKNGVKVISPINIEVWNIILPMILISFVIGIAYEIVKLITGRYNLQVMIMCIITGILQIIITFILLKMIPFFNPDFITFLETEIGATLNSNFDFISWWNSDFIINFLLFFGIMVELIEMGVTIYKTWKYGLDSRG